MFLGTLQFDGGRTIYQRKLCNGGDPMGKIQMTWRQFTTAFTKLKPAHISIGIGGAVHSFGDSPKSFRLIWEMGSLLSHLSGPTGTCA